MAKVEINAVFYDSPEGAYVYCVLDPSIDGEEYVKNLNERAAEYNKDVEKYQELIQELKTKHKWFASFKEVTGADMLNAREPKFPANMPKGVKNAEEAYPEIALERQRRREINAVNIEINNKYGNEVREKVELESKDLKDEIKSKWGEFTGFDSHFHSFEKIYYKFFLSPCDYITKD